MTTELLQQALDALLEYDYAKTDKADRLGSAAIHALREAIALPVLPNIQFLYEELRQLTDGGSESMTHDDALDQIRFLQDQCNIAQPKPANSHETQKTFFWACALWASAKTSKQAQQAQQAENSAGLKALNCALEGFAQPEQPVAYRSLQPSGSYTYCDTPQFFKNAEPVYTTPQPAIAQPEPATERNFCERCGQRLGDDTYIHTCSPPVDATKTDRGLIVKNEAERLRNACATIRSNSMPLSDLIPLMQQAADALDKALLAQSAQPKQRSEQGKRQPPAGYQLVPIEPTPQMIAAGEVYTDTYYSGTDDLLQAYRAMITATPPQGKI